MSLSIRKEHVFIFAAILFLSRLLYVRYATPLRKIPGPILASLTRLYGVWVAANGKAEETYIDLHRRYGPVVRIGPNEVSFSSPAAARTIFKVGAGFHKTDFYVNFLPKATPDIFTEIREDVHAVKKRYAVPPYSLTSVQYHTQEIERLMVKLTDTLDGFVMTGKQACDLDNWLHYFAFDVLGEFAFGQPFTCLDPGSEDRKAIPLIGSALYQGMVVGSMPVLEELTRSNPIWRFLPTFPSPLAHIQQMVFGQLGKYQAAKDSDQMHKCLLQELLKVQQADHGKYSMSDVVAISMGAIGAGSDSTASTMHTFCWHVLANPDVLEKLTAELLTSNLSEIVQYQESLALPYFQACLKEAMRIQPALAYNMSRRVPAGSADIDGTILPGGTHVAVNAWVIHRNEQLFGDNVDSFKPERWLVSEERVKEMERSMYQFGGGAHLCIGRQLALFELNKILPQIFRRYKMQLVRPGQPLAHRTGLFYIQEGLDVYLQKR